MGNKGKVTAPKNWPDSIQYLSSPIYSPRLTKAQLAAIRASPADAPAGARVAAEIPPDLKPGPSANVRITAIADPRHPACGQSGLFVTRDLRPGELVVVYMGEVHPGYAATAAVGRPVDNPHARSDYDLWLDRGADVAVDAAKAGSEARFINDYRGVPDQQRPNAEFREAWDGRRGEKVMAVFVLPAGKKAVGKARLVGIAKGQEILVSYGRGFWQRRAAEEDQAEDGQAGEGMLSPECVT